MLILASASPRRRHLLTQAGITFQVHPANIDESHRPAESPAAYVQRIAEEKARAIFALRSHESPTVLGADTCVLLDNRILGKPAAGDQARAEARAMLQTLSGRTHHVLTGLAVISRAGAATAVETTHVTFNPIDPEELERYLDTAEPFDKAGAYGIQGYAARWIPRIEGCYFNVVGLPIARTIHLLASASNPQPTRGVTR